MLHKMVYTTSEGEQPRQLGKSNYFSKEDF